MRRILAGACTVAPMLQWLYVHTGRWLWRTCSSFQSYWSSALPSAGWPSDSAVVCNFDMCSGEACRLDTAVTSVCWCSLWWVPSKWPGDPTEPVTVLYFNSRQTQTGDIVCLYHLEVQDEWGAQDSDILCDTGHGGLSHRTVVTRVRHVWLRGCQFLQTAW